MKKFMFSAIAMMAFSVSTVANSSITNEKLDNNTTLETLRNFSSEMLFKQNLVFVANNHQVCYNRRVDAYNEARFNGASHEQASTIGYQAYFRCMGELPISQ
jgi:hypothetical protein